VLTLLAVLLALYVADALIGEWVEAKAYRRMNDAAPLMVASALSRRTK
jgi:hypothetical protein